MRTPERQRPAAFFRYSPLVAAFACVFSQASLAVPLPILVNVDGDGLTGTLRAAITTANVCTNVDGYQILVAPGPFTVSVSSPLPIITCPNVEIVGNDNITIQPLASFYGGICGLEAAPTSGLTKISGVKVQNFSYGGSGAGMCGKLDASGNIVSGNAIGFSLVGGANIAGNTISSNTVKGVHDPVGGSTISQNTINGNAGPGILGVDGMVVTGNLVHNNGQHGIEVGANALVTGNTVHSNGWDGIHAGSTAVVKGNTVYGHTSGTGIYATSGAVGGPLTADRNVSHGNTTGVLLYSGIIENNYLGILADGVTAAGNTEGIFASAATNLTIRNNVISGNVQNGIESYGAGTLTIQGNKIGTNAAGTAALGNGYGIDVSYTYGGQIASNQVAGNLNGGITLYNVTLTVTNNQVGGAGPLQNGGDGLEIDYAIGGSVTSNIISGNSGSGLALYGSDNVVISGNQIGTDASGTVGIANAVSGIDAQYSNGLSITGNQISANGFYGGVVLDSVSGVTLQGNLIGTAADGMSALSNNGPGVTIGFSTPPASSARDLEPKSAKVLSGNMLVDNVIAHNNGHGVHLVTGTNNNTITGSLSGQSIHSNNGKNINLDFIGGPRPNDNPDGTVSGPNNGQNRPTIVSVVEDSGSTLIQGSLQSFAPGSVFVNDLPFNGQFEIDLYGNDVPGVPAGKTWLGKTTAVTNTSGMATFTATIPSTGFGHITATATGPFGTSEFSDTLPALVPAASITPMNVPFGNVPVGTTATTPVEVAFRSNGTGNYMIDSISQGATAPTCPATSTPVCATGDFSCSVSCTVGTPYPPLQSPSLPPSCKISGLSFHPTNVGATSTTLWICDNAGPAPRAITLTGTGVANVTVSLSPWDVAFGPVAVGTTSPPRTIAISNNGENGVPLSGLAVTGPFTLVGSTCGTSLPPMSFCEAQVAFAPVAVGLAEGTFSAQIGVEGAPPYIAGLSGTGTQQASLVLPGPIDFGTMLRGEPPRVSTQELRNTGNALLTFSASVSGPFALSGTCGTSLAPGAACNLIITFTPSTVGDFAGSLDISSNAPGGSGSILISARVQAQPRPDIRVDVSEMGFGDRMIGTRSAPQRVTVSNLGTVVAQLGVVPPTRDFVATSQCGATLAPGASCTTDVAFMPMAFGQRLNRLQFTSDAPGSPFGVDLSGRGCSPPRPGRPPSCN